MAMRYVLLKEGPKGSLAKLTKGFKDGVGIRAVAQATGESDFTHLVAIEGPTLAAVLELSKNSALTSSKPMSMTTCNSPLCDGVLGSIFHTLGQPSYMPWLEVTMTLTPPSWI